MTKASDAKDNQPAARAAELHASAEAAFLQDTALAARDPATLTPEDTRALLHESQVHRTILETALDGFWLMDIQGRLLQVNHAYCRMSGYSAQELLGTRMLDLEVQDTSEQTANRISQVMEHGEDRFETRHRRKDGTVFEVEVSVQYRPDLGGRCICFLRDVTERKRLEDETRQMALLMDAAASSITVHDFEGRFLYANGRTFELHGYSREEFMALSLRQVDVPVDQALFAARTQELRERGEARFEVAHFRKDGTILPLEVSAQIGTWGGTQAVFSIATDITERKQAEASLAASAQVLRETQAIAGLGTFVAKFASGRWESSAILDEIFGIDESFERSVEGWLSLVHPEDRARMAAFLTNVALVEQGPHDTEYRIVRKADGEERWVHGRGRLEVDAQNRPAGMLGTIQDITQRRQAEQALAQSQEKFRALSDAAFEAIFISEEGRCLEQNRRAEQMFGYSSEEAVGMLGTEWIAPADRDRVMANMLSGHELPYEATGLRKDGSTFPAIFVGRMMHFDGRAVRVTSVRDLTERKQAEEALEQSRAQLVQAQKMDAIGRLAGGVAHDFNNILQALLSLAAVLPLYASSPELAETVAEMDVLIKRGASLTRQLLLFSRREVSKLERLDLAELVATTGALLRRLIPASIQLTVETTSASLWVEGDLSQLQQVLTNLALNARDAMPRGGTLSVRALGAGGEAVLEVVDTGHGMDANTKAHLFEPFFTTKDSGKGSGLGLSVVDGIVKHHAGRVEVESAPGIGSRFRVILPTVLRPGESEGAQARADAGLARGHGEHILVVEDEEGARTGLTRILKHLGYTVTARGSGEEAGGLPADPAPDLLLTDLMLPGVSGWELAVGLRKRWPRLEVILMSGYAEGEAAVRLGVNDESMRFLQKPFGMAVLARELRAAFDGYAG